MRAGRTLGARGGRLESVRDELRLLLDLLGAWSSGDYRDVSQRTLIAIAGAVLYFVVPMDTVPDFILGLGYLDDAAVIAYVAGLVREELEAFRLWRDASGTATVASSPVSTTSDDTPGKPPAE